MTWGLLIAVFLVLLFIYGLLTLGEGLIKVAATQNGVSSDSYSILPNNFKSFFSSSNTKAVQIPENAKVISLKRGFDINLAGQADPKNEIKAVRVSRYCVRPTDILGMSPIPKVIPEVGAKIKAGEPLFFDKKKPEVIFASPVSGEIAEIKRGEKRLITEITIIADSGEFQYHKHNEIPALDTVSRADLVKFLLSSGAWPFIRQRPYDMIADPDDMPKSIFVSTFDSAPLAPDLNIVVKGKEDAFRKGLEVLVKLSSSKVHVGLSARKSPANVYTEAGKIENVETHWIDGAHPAGNIGVQIHHIDPVTSGSQVWYLDVHGVILIGNLFLKGQFDTEKIVALCGAELKNPRYISLHQCANLEEVLSDLAADFKEELEWVRDENNVKIQKPVSQRTIRIISGDVLSGTQIERNDPLRFYDDQITVVKEGRYYEAFGWLIPLTSHPTLSRTFIGGFHNDIEYVADTNTNGEKRAFVMTGEYESVLPMDIYPQHVFRAIMCNDIEKMEALGLLELSEEDIALCEYVCTSKQPLQKMLREGLETLRTS
jgi:Na+-transporting NADH:ubiquinone oxidoreductase subunit A